MDSVSQKYQISYAQNREDAILSAFFDGVETGFYVDVGASHPEKLSVTKLFYQKGWRGINIEPIPELFRMLEKNRPRDINLHIGISDKKGKLTLREYPDADGFSTFSESMQKSYIGSSATKRYIDFKVQVLPLRDVFKEYKVGAIEFMKVDVEGFEHEVLVGNDWKIYRPKVLCIEAEHIVKDWRPLMKKYDYSLVFFDGLNEYYVANECQDVRKNFSYVRTLDRPPAPAELIEKVDMYHGELVAQQALLGVRTEQYQKESERQVQAIDDLTLEVRRLNDKLLQSMRVRYAAKNILAAINRAVVDHLKRLDKPRESELEVPRLEVSKSMSKAKVLQRIRRYDVRVYCERQPRLAYRFAYAVYRAPAVFFYNLMRYTFRALRGRQHVS